MTSGTPTILQRIIEKYPHRTYAVDQMALVITERTQTVRIQPPCVVRGHRIRSLELLPLLYELDLAAPLVQHDVTPWAESEACSTCDQPVQDNGGSS